eukprot:2436484-Pyramimonas_sp.AAC.1
MDGFEARVIVPAAKQIFARRSAYHIAHARDAKISKYEDRLKQSAKDAKAELDTNMTAISALVPGADKPIGHKKQRVLGRIRK